MSSDEEEQTTHEASSAPTDVHVIEGEVEDRPGYTYDRFLGWWLEITPAEQALQQQEEAKKEAFIKKRALELKKNAFPQEKFFAILMLPWYKILKTRRKVKLG